MAGAVPEKRTASFGAPKLDYMYITKGIDNMNYTPYARLTNEELVQEICTKPDVTDLELEAMQRIDHDQTGRLRQRTNGI